MLELTDNVDIGDVDKVGDEFIVVREGVANVHLYYIPKKYIIKYDGQLFMGKSLIDSCIIKV